MARKTASLWYVAMVTDTSMTSVMSFSSQFGSHLDSVPAGPGINDNGWVELFVGVANSYICILIGVALLLIWRLLWL